MSYYKNRPNTKQNTNIIEADKMPLKSTHGRRCLTKCYPKGEVYLHPILLDIINSHNIDSCAIDPVHTRETNIAKLDNMIWIDNCKTDDNKLFRPPNELDSMLLSFYFNPSDFLSSVYNLHSFDQVIYWTLDNDYLPFATIKRVHNCAWKVYGNNIEEITNTVIEYYYDISKSYWLREYTTIIENDYSFNIVSDEYDKSDDQTSEEIVYDIILANYYSYDFFSSSIKRYVYEYEDKWDIIISHYDNIKKYILSQLIERIKNK